MNKFHQDPNQYLANPRKKDYYPSIYRILESNNVKRLLDIGTASGDFLFFLPDQINAVGIDSSNVLINEAKKSRKKPNLIFEVADFYEFSNSESFDAITILGTLVTMEDWQKVIEKCILMRPKVLIIHDVLNPEPIDIKLGFKESLDSKSDFNFGYNVVSVKSVTNFFLQHEIEFEISEFQMHSTLYKDKLYPMHNFHVILNGRRVLTNGTGLILHMFNVVAHIR
ncbi:MAG: class I SAM-dependent methyltransferase [Crocinitomicaceae bacterium]|nr:class I SAM-dependent methyltransferase [Crocinitomicaceae bacterium]